MFYRLLTVVVTGLLLHTWSRSDAAAQRGVPPKKATAAASPLAAPKREQAVPFSVGETLTYDVSWSSYLTAGSATLTVLEKKASYGSTAYYIVAEGKPGALLSKLYNLHYKADTLLDVYTLLPQRGSIFSQEGKRNRTKITVFDHAAKKAQYEVQTGSVAKTELALPAFSQDALGAVYVLRALALKTGDKFTIPVCDAGQIFRVQMSIGPVEPVKTGIGEIRAFKITPALPAAAAARRLTIWVSDDARKLPLRMQAQLAVGSFDLALSHSNR